MMNYNTKHICTYNDDNIFNDNDNISEKDKDFVRDALYRNDILYIFYVEEFDKDILNLKLKELYNKIKNNEIINNLMKKLAKIYLSEDPEMGILILFSFDYLHISHPIISEYLDKGFISDENINRINNIVI